MKKILVIHNRYQNVGGEDIAVEREIALLKETFNVKEIYYDNKIISKLTFLKLLITLKNQKSVNELATLYTSFDPDYVYVHNTWFNASLEIFKFLEEKEANLIVKLHNFRYSCTKQFRAKDHLMKKDVCLACGFKFQKYQYFNKYFEESYLKSIFVNNYGKKYYKILASSNFKIAVLTKFHMNYLIDLGFDKNRIEIVPNYIDDYTVSVNINPNKNFVYAGRISNEKGVKELIDAFNKLNYEGVKLQIIGDGPLLSTLVKNNTNSNIEFYGQMNNKEVKELIKKSLAVVTATKLLEGQPTILHEASLLKKPSVYPNTGGLREFFPKNNTLSFEQFNYTDLKHKMSLLLNNLDEALNLGEENYNFITENFSKQKILDKYIEIFN